MRTLLALLCLCCAGSIASAQEVTLFTVKQIVNNLSGRWVMESEPDASGKTTYDCTGPSVLRIRLVPGAKSITYISTFEDGKNKEDRSTVSAESANNDVDQPGAIVLQYEGESRLDDNGKPVVWHLLMTNRDTFYWHREDWPNGETTRPSHRCPDPGKVG